MREFQLEHGIPKAQAYSVTMYVMCGLLGVGFLLTLAIRSVNARFHAVPVRTK